MKLYASLREAIPDVMCCEISEEVDRDEQKLGGNLSRRSLKKLKAAGFTDQSPSTALVFSLRS